jgi:ferredoxin
MTIKRKIIKIDEQRCNGCGICALACAEGAIEIIGGKARLVSDTYCDGLGACIGECPQNALVIQEREAGEYDEEEVKSHIAEKQQAEKNIPFGWASEEVSQFELSGINDSEPLKKHYSASTLNQWPVQLRLVPATASFLRHADLILVGDCVPFAYGEFHWNLLKGHALLVACPKLDDFDAHLEKLTDILRCAGPKSITVVHMEVPCCSGLVLMAKQAIAESGRNIPLNEITVGTRGSIL